MTLKLTQLRLSYTKTQNPGKMKNRFLLISLLLLSFLCHSQVDYSKFEGIKSKISINKEFSLANIYDYKYDAKEDDSLLVKSFDVPSLESALSKKYTEKFSRNVDSTVFSVKLITRLIVEVDNEKNYLISFKTSDNQTKQVLNFKKENLNFKEAYNSTKEIDLLKSILQNSNAFIVFQFYNKRMDSNYPEINKLKPLTKNEQGILDIEKLENVIRENKSSLDKYLEE